MSHPSTPDRRPQEATALWSLREDVRVEPSDDGHTVEIHGRWLDLRISRPGPVLLEALRRMTLGPVNLANIQGIRAGDGVLAEVLRSLHDLVVRSLALRDSGQLLLSVVPLARTARFDPEPPPEGRLLKLSRFAVLRRDGDRFVLESPLSLHRVVLCAPEAQWVVAALGRPTLPEDAAARTPLAPPVVREILGHLIGTGMVLVSQSGGEEFEEDEDAALRTWSAPDLLFHTRSVTGRDDGDFGATFAHAGSIDPQPAVKKRPAGPTVALPRPDLGELLSRDPQFTTVLEGRHSTRGYGSAPLSLRTLGEFLYRTARVRSVRETGADTLAHAVSDRPYPSGGAAYDLELYLTVRGCEGVPDGIHYYAPDEHCLVAVNEEWAAAEELMAGAVAAAALSGPPSVLITLTSRFQRLSWKYGGLAYALVLKHVGVLLQTFYLVGSAMGLAACAVCSEDIELCARAFGLDWRTESAVGSFVLGSAPQEAERCRPQWVDVNDAHWHDRSAVELREGLRPPAA
ncbi:SagB/ThcOx family dehydrogenase [Streptomyces sp. BR1]|uniref:SagB/ThcOx family dehydrogenase n=1 Tax=Streptomyces sp. BR1 TaxID=1592323 RepID=UPI00402B89D4